MSCRQFHVPYHELIFNTLKTSTSRVCPFPFSANKPQINSFRFKLLPIFILFFLSISANSQIDPVYQGLSELIKNFTNKNIDPIKIKEASEAKNLTSKIVQIDKSLVAYNEVGKMAKYKGTQVSEKCLYQYRRYWSKESSVTSNEKQLSKEKENVRNASSTYERNLYQTRYNNQIDHLNKAYSQLDKAIEEYNRCNETQKRKIKSAETILERHLDNFIKEVESYTPSIKKNSKVVRNEVSNVSEKEYGMRLIKELARKGDAAAKKIVNNGSVEKEGDFTLFFEEEEYAPLFMCYKVTTPDRTIIVLRRMDDNELPSTLIAMEDATRSKKGTVGLSYYDPKLVNDTRVNSIGIGGDYSQKYFSHTTLTAETKVVFKDASLNRTTGRNAVYYDIQDIISQEDGDEIVEVTRLYSIEERRKASDSSIQGYKLKSLLWDVYHTNFAR